jgi:hypothetical protein
LAAFESIKTALEKNGHMTNVGEERHKTVMLAEWREAFVNHKADSKSIYTDWERGRKAMFDKGLVGYHKTSVAEYCWIKPREIKKDEPYVSPF